MELKEIEIEERILDKARELFFFFGIKSITIDDISKHLGISQKTIYTHFRDKNEIVNVVMENLLKKHIEKIVAAQEKSDNAVEDVILQSKALYSVFKDVKPSVFFEVEKYFPKIAEQFTDHRYKCMLETIKTNLKRGIAEKIYREDLDIAIISQIRLNLLVSTFDEKAYASVEFGIPKIMNELTLFYLNSICNSNGKQLIGTHLNQHK